MRAIDADTLITQIVTTTEEAFMNASWKQGMTYALGLVETQPTIQPEPHWIPVTQDTPTEDDDYWCTFGAETGWFVDWCSWYQGRWVVWTDDTVSEVSNVIAWCKPIEPYKG